MSRPVRLTLALVFLLVASAGAAAVPATAGGDAQSATAGPAGQPHEVAGSAEGDSINVTYEVSLTPNDPGEVSVTARFEVPDSVTSLTVTVEEDDTVHAREGFQRRGQTEYEWNRGTDTPSITYSTPANVTVNRQRTGSDISGYVYADVGEWALVRAPSLDLTYSGTGPRASVHRDVTVDGAGAAGDDIVFLGKAREHRVRTNHQTFRLVVPGAADMRESPDQVLQSLGDASKAIEFGARDGEVFVVAAPTGQVRWGTTGLQRGESDMWVRDKQRLGSAENVWLHEYVHTRQEFQPTSETKWAVEGSADYYAALLSLKQGRIDYQEFRERMATGRNDEYSDVVLAEPDTWAGTQANYWKGALAIAATDRTIRQESNGTYDFQRVLRRVGDKRLTQDRLLDAVRAAGGQDAAAFARRHTETSATPELWSEAEHRRTFGDAAQVEYTIDSVRVTGPYRNETFDRPPTVVTGERVEVRVVAENVGSSAGSYDATLLYRGLAVGSQQGRLGPGERTRLTYVLTPGVGEGRLTMGGSDERGPPLVVADPATPTVTSVRAPETVAPGEPFRVRVALHNGENRPGKRNVAVRVDGVRVGNRTVRLAPGASTTVAVQAAVDEPGAHVVSVGDRNATVHVAADGGPVTDEHPASSGDGADGAGGGDGAAGDEATAGRSGGDGSDGDGRGPLTPTGVGGAGFGVAAALVAVAALLALRRR